MIAENNGNKCIISVIIPMYNAGTDIICCIKSLVKQTFEKKYEIIVVDDASTDNSVSILKNELTKDEYKNSVIHLIECNKNGRAGSARNIGITISEGYYIVYVDQDDLPKEDFLDKLYSASNNGEVDCVTCNIKEKSGTVYYRADLICHDKISQKNREIIISHSGYVFAVMVKRQIIIDNNLFFPEGLLFEDTLYPFGIYAHINSYSHVNEAIYFRNTSISSQTSSLNSEKILHRIMSTEWYLNHYSEDKQITEIYGKEISNTSFYYIYSSNIWWMILDPIFRPQIYSRKVFYECLNWMRKQSNIPWNSGKYPQEGKSVRLALKIVYYLPFSFYLFRWILRSAIVIIDTIRSILFFPIRLVRKAKKIIDSYSRSIE